MNIGDKVTWVVPTGTKPRVLRGEIISIIPPSENATGYRDHKDFIPEQFVNVSVYNAALGLRNTRKESYLVLTDESMIRHPREGYLVLESEVTAMLPLFFRNKDGGRPTENDMDNMIVLCVKECLERGKPNYQKNIEKLKAKPLT